MVISARHKTHSKAGGNGWHILIDALAARFGGTATATADLARHLSMRPEVATVSVVTRSGSILERTVAQDPGVRCVSLRGARRGELLRRIAWETTRLPALVARERADVVISMSGMLPRSAKFRLICLLGNPVMYEQRTVANRMRQAAVRHTAKHAEYLAAPSRIMAGMVSAAVGRDCGVAPWGVDHRAFSPPAKPGSEILCVADFKAYKRHDLVLDAWLRLPQPRPILSLVGNPDVDRRAHEELRARISALPDAASVKLEHKVPYARMPDVYRRARVFVMPSEHESFCMPLAEAMACGVPAVVRGLPSLRETGRSGAKYIEGDDVAQWAGAIRELVDDDVTHENARRAAARAAARFSWEGLAEDLLGRL